MKWFRSPSPLCQHFYRGHFSRPGSRLLSAYGYSSSFCGTLLQSLSTTYVSHLPFHILYKYYIKNFYKNQLFYFSLPFFPMASEFNSINFFIKNKIDFSFCKLKSNFCSMCFQEKFNFF